MNNDDYLFNLSTVSSQFSNLPSVDVEIAVNPAIPIEIYYVNATVFTSCFRDCYIKSIPISFDYILRIDKYLINDQSFNYTLSIQCYKPIQTTTMYATSSTTLKKIDYSVSFNQQLTFGNRGNILSFGVSTLIALFFITMGLFIHRQSNRIELRFLARRSNSYFYICSIVTLLTNIIMCSTSYLDDRILGILITLTMSSINFVSAIGTKYYGSFFSDVMIKNITLARLSRFGTLSIAVLYLCIYYIRLDDGYSLISTVLIITYIQLAILTLWSLASKTAQVQWLILFILIAWLHDSTHEEIFFDFYWYSMGCIGCAITSIFFFVDPDTLSAIATDISETNTTLISTLPNALRSMYIKVFGAFLSMFDIGMFTQL